MRPSLATLFAVVLMVLAVVLAEPHHGPHHGPHHQGHPFHGHNTGIVPPDALPFPGHHHDHHQHHGGMRMHIPMLRVISLRVPLNGKGAEVTLDCAEDECIELPVKVHYMYAGQESKNPEQIDAPALFSLRRWKEVSTVLSDARDTARLLIVDKRSHSFFLAPVTSSIQVLLDDAGHVSGLLATKSKEEIFQKDGRIHFSFSMEHEGDLDVEQVSEIVRPTPRDAITCPWHREHRGLEGQSDASEDSDSIAYIQPVPAPAPMPDVMPEKPEHWIRPKLMVQPAGNDAVERHLRHRGIPEGARVIPSGPIDANRALRFYVGRACRHADDRKTCALDALDRAEQAIETMRTRVENGAPIHVAPEEHDAFGHDGRGPREEGPHRDGRSGGPRERPHGGHPGVMPFIAGFVVAGLVGLAVFGVVRLMRRRRIVGVPHPMYAAAAPVPSAPSARDGYTVLPDDA